MQILVLLSIALVAWWLQGALVARAARVRELGRFRRVESDLFKDASVLLDRLAAGLDVGAVEDLPRRSAVSKADNELAERLAKAGLETPLQRGRYVLARNLCWIGFPLAGFTGYLWLPPYYATVWALLMTAIGVLVPLLWLRAKTLDRVEQIRRELPLLLDLTNLGTSAGWDVVASLEKVIDGLYLEFPEHPLIHEMKRGRWLTASGYTWNEALDKVSARLGDEAVARTMSALGQAITQGGSRSRQLESIAQDTQQSYYAQLERRLAAMPVHVVLVTVVLLVSYFVILLAPALVQLSGVLSGG